MRIDVEYDGLDESQRKANAEFKAGVIDWAAGVQAVAQQLAPVDTGYMRAHIFLRPEGYPKVDIVSEANYSLYVERGHRVAGAEPPVYVPGQPFMRPAHERTRLVSEAHLADRLRRTLS